LSAALSDAGFGLQFADVAVDSTGKVFGLRRSEALFPAGHELPRQIAAAPLQGLLRASAPHLASVAG